MHTKVQNPTTATYITPKFRNVCDYIKVMWNAAVIYAYHISCMKRKNYFFMSLKGEFCKMLHFSKTETKYAFNFLIELVYSVSQFILLSRIWISAKNISQ